MTTASLYQLPNGRKQYIDANGNPLVGGTVAHYIVATTTPVITYIDDAGTTPNANPIVLDSAGSCVAFYLGQAREVVKDALGNTISDSTITTGPAEPVSTAMLPFVGSTSLTSAFNLLTYLDPAISATTRTVTSRLSDMALLLTDFGADGTGVTFSDTAWSEFVTAVMVSGRPGIVPVGHYKFASASVVDWGAISANGGSASITGVTNRSILDFSAVTTAPALTMTGSVRKALFYGTFSGISVLANCPGPAVQIGATDNSVAFNGYNFGLQISNANTTSSAIGLAVYGAFDCNINVTANNNGHGDALLSDYMAFCTVTGSLGHADTGLHLTNFFTFGNVFNAMDIEVVNLCVLIDSVHASANTWVGGQFVWSNGTGTPIAGINATAGGNNRFIGVNWASGLPIATGITGILTPGYGIGTEVFAALDVSPLGAFDGNVTIDSLVAQNSTMILRRAGLARWQIARNNSTEAGSNVGSDLLVTRFNDAGTSIDNPLTITRSTGQTNILNLAAAGGTGGTLSFFGSAPITKPTVTGSMSGGTALPSLLTTLATLGLIINSTTA